MLDEDLARLRNDGVNLRAVSERPAVTGTTGRGLRRQKWGALVVATSDDTPRTAENCALERNMRAWVHDDDHATLAGSRSLCALVSVQRPLPRIASGRAATWRDSKIERPKVMLRRAVARSEQQSAADGGRTRDPHVRHRHQHPPPRAAAGRDGRHAAHRRADRPDRCSLRSTRRPST